jgi:hypothetical protein
LIRLLQHLLGLFLAFLGGGYVLLLVTGDGRLLVVAAIYVAILFGLFFAAAGDGWFSRFSTGFLIGSAVVAGFTSYGYLLPSLVLTLVGATCLVLLRKSQFGFRTKPVCVAWMIVSAVCIFAFASYHLLFSGRIFAFKWSRIEHPIFWTPFEIRSAELHGRKAIHLFDYNGADPSAVAIVWGWSLFPKFAYPEDPRPTGLLLNNKAIQEAIR